MTDGRLWDKLIKEIGLFGELYIGRWMCASSCLKLTMNVKSVLLDAWI